MGLAASQARLLTITSRKSDCEYMSMKYSHQKLELAREMSEISNEYQESLNQTELYYDFYGTGDTSNPLTYSLMMTPSALNDYMPTLLTNQQGRIVLDSSYAACARAAGIPQEGLGGTASTAVRNSFVEALYTNGFITESSKNAIQSTTYNNEAGLGSTDVSTLTTTDMTLEELLDYIAYDTITVCAVDLGGNDDNGKCDGGKVNTDLIVDGEDTDDNSDVDLNIAKLLDSDSDYAQNTYIYLHCRNGNTSDANTILEELIEEFDAYFSSLFNTDDSYTAAALAYAKTMTTNNFSINGTTSGVDYLDEMKYDSTKKYGTNIDSEEYLAWVGGARSDGDKIKVALNVSNLLYAYLTYYAQYLEGIATSDYSVVANASKSQSNLIDSDYVFSVVTEDTISTTDSNLAFFYDTLFNQICVNGWTENDNVTDQEYMQEMLKNGMLYISTCSDDGYYYQGNYSTNTLIKEVSDDSGIAQAEAEYTTMKAKLTAKEDELDLKMNNLDTEISSLTTEYDSVKSVIDKNIEKSFTRYDA